METEPVWIDVGDREFEDEVLRRSEQRPVVVDFWAPWCAPCRTLAPLLERLVAEHRGEVLLARVNVDEAPAVAQQLGIRSIPTVIGVRDGAIVAELVGAQPEPALRQLLEKVLPSEADRLAREGASLAGSGDAEAAEARFREALEREPRHARALLGLGRLLGERGDLSEALSHLELIAPTAPVYEEAERYAAELRMRELAPGDETSLRGRIELDPDDLDARIELGRGLAAGERYEEALAELLAAVRIDPAHANAAARRAMLDIFSVLGDRHPVTERFRRELARALYR